MHEWMNKQMRDDRMNEWINKLMKKWKDKWMNRYTK